MNSFAPSERSIMIRARRAGTTNADVVAKSARLNEEGRFSFRWICGALLLSRYAE